MNQRREYKWMLRFKEGWASGGDACSEWLSTVMCVEVKEQTDRCIGDKLKIKH
jgi:hypothetical protein